VAARKPKPLRRRAGNREQRERLLIYTESDVREPSYLNGLLGDSLPGGCVPGRQDRAGSSVVFGTTHGEPLGLVRAAIAHKRREQLAGDAFSQVWCVFDVACPEPRKSLDEAMRLAERHGISCAVTRRSAPGK
jgi:hypothetical protein